MLPARYGPDADVWECPCGTVNLATSDRCRYCNSFAPDTTAARIMRSAEERQERLKRERERHERG